MVAEIWASVILSFVDQLVALKTSLLYTRCLRTVNVTCIKSKVGLVQTAHSWAKAGVLFGARVGRRVAFETIKLIHAKVLCRGEWGPVSHRDP